jgi:acetyl-CoA acetyltransferase
VYALGLAELLISHGGCRTVLSYFGSDFGTSPGGPYAFPVGVETKKRYEAPHGWFGQPVYFAAMAERYAIEFGLPEEALAAVAIAAREAAQLTDDAVLRRPLDMERYLEEPRIAGRFRRADCSVISDGASAFVVQATDAARNGPHPPVALLGCGQASEPGNSSDSFWTQRPSLTVTPCVASAAEAFAQAGLQPSDVDVAEIYDCFTISTILQLEDAGFCAKGDGAAFVASGAIGLAGSLPTNTHGGLLCHSYTVGAHHIVEATRQLRGEAGLRQVQGAEVAYVAGLGLPEHASALLGVLR